MRNSNNITDRKKLKEFFKKGNLPGESAFIKLIDSTFNIADDKLDINQDGLMIYPSENGKDKLLSFFEDRDDTDATWVMFISKKENGGISINQINQSKNDDNSTEEQLQPPAFFIEKNSGKVGLGKDSPDQLLDVNGLIASKGRVGTFCEGQVEADGDWHNVFDTKLGLHGCNAYEIMAYAEGASGEGKFSLMHAIAISTLGNSRPKISKTRAHHGKWWNKIDIRWESRPSRIAEESPKNKKKVFILTRWWRSFQGWLEQKDTDKYNLQIRTKSNYGDGFKLYFKVSVLWNSDFIKTVK